MPSKKYYWRNPEKHREATNAYRLANPDWHRESNRDWVAKKRSENPGFDKEAQKKHRKKNQAKRQAATTAWARSKPGYWLFKNAQYRAKTKGLPFTIKFEDIVIPDVCPVFGIPIRFGESRMGFQPNSPSLDRIIPHLGYTKENMRVISNRANRIKSDGTLAEMEAIVAYIRREAS